MRLPFLPSADDLTRLGITEMNRGNHEVAVRAFTRALKKSPKSVSALANRASVYTALGRHEDALADLNRAIALLPVMAALYFNRAGVHRARGHRALAVADYTQAIALEPDQIGFYFNRALVVWTDAPDAALSDLNRVLELKPDYTPALAERGRLRQALGQTGDAAADLRAYLAARPDAPDRAEVENRLRDLAP